MSAASPHVILVLGCPARADRTPSRALRRRLSCALREAEADPEAILVLSGGPVLGPPEAQVMRDWLRAAGVESNRIVVEDRSRMTVENVVLLVPLLAKLEPQRITLVTDPYHLPRARLLLRLALRRQRLGRIPIRSAAAEHAPGRSVRYRMAVAEVAKLGWSVALFPALALWHGRRH